LKAGVGLEIRPTADRVRESLFSILGETVRQAVVLDLFAGTGALGIEALSRGTASAVFVDNRRQALSVVHHNLSACNLQSRAQVILWDIRRNLNCLRSFRGYFTLVFMDPPYNRCLASVTLEHLVQAGCLKSGTRLVVEHSLREKLENLPSAFTCGDRRQYGKTLVSFLEYML